MVSEEACGGAGREWTHLGFSHSELMAWTLSVMVSGDMSVRLGSFD